MIKPARSSSNFFFSQKGSHCCDAEYLFLIRVVSGICHHRSNRIFISVFSDRSAFHNLESGIFGSAHCLTECIFFDVLRPRLPESSIRGRIAAISASSRVAGLFKVVCSKLHVIFGPFAAGSLDLTELAVGRRHGIRLRRCRRVRR